jgi:hypothetical protein
METRRAESGKARNARKLATVANHRRRKGRTRIFVNRIFQVFAQAGCFDAGGATDPARPVHLIGLYMLPVSI